VEEAGGRLTDFSGTPTVYTGTAVTTNGHLHAALLRLLQAGRQAQGR
jgi:fructose-1,6-bisphosphatase/inositol monophosphatase family enzyme